MRLKLPGISNLLYFAERKYTTHEGKIARQYLCPIEFAAQEDIDVDGSIYYYGICDSTVTNFHSSNKTEALLDGHRYFFNGIKDLLYASEAKCKTAILGLQPPKDKTKHYEYVTNHLDLIKQLAIELKRYHDEALNKDKNFRIIIRYASEMNASDNEWHNNPEEYKSTYRAISKIFKIDVAFTDVQFNFSPVMRIGMDLSTIKQYWPGDDYVDIVSCTWYIGKKEDAENSTKRFDEYFQWAMDKGKPFGIDELGGRNLHYTEKSIDNSERISLMMEHLISLGKQCDYVTTFLGGSDDYPYKYAVTLEHLKERFVDRITNPEMDLPSVSAINRNSLLIEEQYALNILENLPLQKFNKLKEWMNLSTPNVIGPETLEKFYSRCKYYGFDLSVDGINHFKDRHNLGNTGNAKGIIGKQTAAVYYQELMKYISRSPNPNN